MKKLATFEHSLSHLAFQAAMSMAQIYSAYGSMVPSRYKPLAAFLMAIAQAYVIYVNHPSTQA
jgi:hypothetical protein